MAWGQWAIGGCNCGCPGYPCTLPSRNINVAYSLTGYSSPGGVLVYTAPCFWQGCIQITSTGGSTSSVLITVAYAGGCTYYEFEIFVHGTCTGLSTGTTLYDHPTGCSSIDHDASYEIKSYSCSPFQIGFGNTLGTIWTLT